MEHKRRRVTRACDRCRTLKTKCDGAHPVCARCKAYGYVCNWNEGGRRGQTHPAASIPVDIATPASSHDGYTAGRLQQAIRAYEDLFQDLRSDLSESHQAKVDLGLARIRTHLPDELTSSLPEASTGDPKSAPLSRSASPGQPRQRYLGWSSDMDFVNSMHNLLRGSHHVDQPSTFDSYEQDDSDSRQSNGRLTLKLPTRELADRWVHTYFSSIHVAHPIICQQRFLRHYKNFCESLSTKDVPRTWSAKFLSVLALGSYYGSFSNGRTSDASVHESYFRYSEMLSENLESEYDRDYVCLLIVQCMYLLASCQTDKCWTRLGTAIRVAQSIGLHVEDEVTRRISTHSKIDREMRRRTWHSLYVLDRLLSLQLGRPLAINHEDTAVKAPSQVDDMEFDMTADIIPTPESSWKPQFGDYFRAVIKLSHIIGSVVRELYRPNTQQELDLNLVEDIDRRLVQWRGDLPQGLRFDIDQSGDASPTLRRQRNILSIKFHHLRALVHRVHLSLPWLLQDGSAIMTITEQERVQVVNSEGICVSAARDIARMLQDVGDEKNLVHDFPFWQMISCLTCATSILLVASKFHEPASPDDTAEALHRDATTCLRALDALSPHSDAARLVAKMMRALQSSKRSNPTEPFRWRPRNIRSNLQITDMLTPAQTEHTPASGNNDDYSGNWLAAQYWPTELSEPLSWSSQFMMDDYFSNPELYYGTNMPVATNMAIGTLMNPLPTDVITQNMAMAMNYPQPHPH